MMITPLRSLLALAVAAAVLSTTLAASGSAQEEGHWEVLGEDGIIWVPAHPPLAPSYLPAPHLGDYHNASEAFDAITALAAARPDILSVRVDGTSVQGRPLLVATLTAPGDTAGRTRVLFDGAHHGDEVIAAEILVRFLQRAVGEYDSNATMRAALAQTIVDVVPMVNPDGIDFVPQCSHYAQCRKNANGVDLNRNYPAHWGEPGSSGDPNSATYRGPAPASEPETRVIRDLLDTGDYAIYASLHSGAEMILWPWGWTTTPPPEAPIYDQLGDELTAITGAPHGQVSRILYGVSGDSMDQAYGEAAGWRALAISPETYKGSGSAFDWWFLFNPPETDTNIAPVAARWDRFLRHLVDQAPLYAPAKLEAPEDITLGPDSGELNFVVTGAPRRPLQGASVAFSAPPGVVDVLSANPVLLADASGAQSGAFTLRPARGGDFAGLVELDAGPAGRIARALDLHLAQVALILELERAVMGSPESNSAALVVDAGPFARATGSIELTAQPQGLALGSAAFDVMNGAPGALAIPFDALALRGGDHTIVARATFTAIDAEGDARAGEIAVSVPLLVLRPQVDIEKRFLPSAAAGEPVLITSIYRNTGSATAQGLVVRETIPLGYTYYVRDGPVPVPVDPLGKPVPASLEPQADGSVVATWSFGNVAPGQIKFAQYRLMPLVPGEHTLASAWDYTGVFPTTTLAYSESAAPVHTVTGP